MQKIYLIESVSAIREKYCKALSNFYQIKVCDNTEKALEEMIEYRPDLLVLDMSVPGLDSLALVDHAYMLGLRPKIIVSTLHLGGALEERLYRYGSGMVLMRPFAVDLLEKVSVDILLEMEDDEYSSLRRIANNLLLMMGFRLDLQGYRYVLESVVYGAVHMDCKLTGELYPYVAKKLGMNTTAVEKGCCRCIEKAWMFRNDQVWNLYFPNGSNGKKRSLTNAVFIKRMGYAVYESFCYKNSHQIEK